MIKKHIILDRDSEILAVTQGLQRRLWDTMRSPPGLWWCWPLDEMPQCNTCCQDLVQTVDKQQDIGELIAPLLPRQNKVSLFHVPLPQKKKNSPYGPGLDSKTAVLDISASNAMETWVWLTVYGLWSLSFLIDSETIWSVLRYTLFILLRSPIVLMVRAIIMSV